jgi:hypothetical protein
MISLLNPSLTFVEDWDGGVSGGNDDDTVLGGDGKDTVNGGPGND